ncbi:MAG: Zn-ribbon domain-containing OB-fold protein [Chloroflexota bacterium]
MQQPMRKPLPFVYDENRPFWDGAKKHQLLIQKCKDCGKFQFYPRSMCMHCLSENIEWVKASGKGKVYSFTIAHRPGNPAFAADVPYNIAIIELEEGVRMPSKVVDCKNEDIKCDMPVEVVFRDETPELAIPYFRPTK